MAGRIDGLSVALLAAGGLATYSGVKGYSIPHALTAFVQGRAPSGPADEAITGTAAGTSSASTGTVPAPAGGDYSNGQLRSLWTMAGGDASKAAVAACIAGHESSGHPDVTSPNPDGGTNVGLWQLDTNGKGSGYTVEQLQNPLTNARLAVAGSNNGTDWSAWATASMCGA